MGVTESAIFDVNLKFLCSFLYTMTGSACAAIVCTLTSTTANAIGVGGIPGILSIQPQYMPSFALAMLVAIAVPFVLTVAVGKQKGIDKQAQAAQAEADETAAKEAKLAEIAKNVESEHEIKAYLDGQVIRLKKLATAYFLKEC